MLEQERDIIMPKMQGKIQELRPRFMVISILGDDAQNRNLEIELLLQTGFDLLI